jgi:DNA polymerase III delta prime subunit
MAPLYGQKKADARIRTYLKNPTSCAFLFHGPTGTGKTMAAHNLADSLEVDRSSNGGFDEIRPGHTAEAVREVEEKLRSKPMVGKWRCVIINQCECMRPQTEKMWLGILDELPQHVVIVFTSIYIEELSKEFTDRCTHVPFFADAKLVREFAKKEWERQMPSRPVPRSLEKAGFREDCLPSYRLAIKDVESIIQQIQEPDMGDSRLWIVHDKYVVKKTFESWLEDDARGFLSAIIHEGFNPAFLSRTAESVKNNDPIPADAQRCKPRSA